MKTIIHIFLVCLATTITYVSAQTQISGTVKSDDGNPLPAANLAVKGTTSGTMTDMDGKFFLNLTEADM